MIEEFSKAREVAERYIGRPLSEEEENTVLLAVVSTSLLLESLHGPKYYLPDIPDHLPTWTRFGL